MEGESKKESERESEWPQVKTNLYKTFTPTQRPGFHNAKNFISIL